jgi:ribosomal subunit interface protein
MLIQVNYSSVVRTDAIDDFVNQRVEKELAHYTDRLTRVEVHLHDDNGAAKHAANDKRVTMEARPRGLKPLAVEHAGDNLQVAISEAASKLQRALRRSFERMS